jgi:hypothetical protein
MIPLSLHFEDDDTRICWLAYLTDIFSKLNGLNIQNYGNNEFSMENRVDTFHRKLFLCQGGVWTPPFRNSGVKSYPWIKYSDGFDIFV